MIKSKPTLAFDFTDAIIKVGFYNESYGRSVRCSRCFMESEEADCGTTVS